MRPFIGLLCFVPLACTCQSSEKGKLAEVRSPVSVDLQKTSTTAPNLSGTPGAPSSTSNYELVIGAKPPLRIYVSCSVWAMQVAVSANADRVTYRCNKSDAWSFAYPAPPPSGVVSWKAALAANDFPSWEQVPAIADAATPMILSGGAPPDTVIDAVRASGGEAAVSLLLPKLPTMGLRSEANGRTDIWFEALQRLPATSRAPAIDALRKALATPNSGAGPVRRALLVFASDDSVLDDLAARLSEVDEAERHAKRTGDVVAAVWQQQALERLIEKRRALAAKIGCARLTRNRYDAVAKRAAALGECPQAQ